MRDRNAVRGAQTAEAPALHAALEALALGAPTDVNHLPGDKMLGRQLGADIEEVLLADAELVDIGLGLDLGLAEVAALRLGNVLHLRLAGAELNGNVAVNAFGLLRDNLELLELQDGDGHMAPIVLEQPGHPHLLRDHASAHDPIPSKQRLQDFSGSLPTKKAPGFRSLSPIKLHAPPGPVSNRWVIAHLSVESGDAGNGTFLQRENAVRYPCFLLRPGRSKTHPGN